MVGILPLVPWTKNRQATLWVKREILMMDSTTSDANKIIAAVFGGLVVLLVIVLGCTNDPSIGGMGSGAGPLFLLVAICTIVIACLMAMSYRRK